MRLPLKTNKQLSDGTRAAMATASFRLGEKNQMFLPVLHSENAYVAFRGDAHFKLGFSNEHGVFRTLRGRQLK